ncbi:MAG: 4Fe-4S dicluster domain-containing protein [Coriobacteriia bacterium]
MNGLLIDYEYCSGCHSCEMACKNEHDIPLGKWGIKVLEDGPWKLPDGNWHWDYMPVPTEICDLCQDRVAQGQEPSCVQHCQAKVMQYGTIEELAQKAADIGKKAVIFLP